MCVCRIADMDDGFFDSFRKKTDLILGEHAQLFNH